MNQTREELTDTIGNVLRYANQFHAISVSLPPIGAGTGGFTTKLSARLIIDVLSKYFIGTNKASVKYVCLVSTDRRKMDTSVEELKKVQYQEKND